MSEDFKLICEVINNCVFNAKKDAFGKVWQLFRFNSLVLAYDETTYVTGYFVSERPSSDLMFLDFHDTFLIFHRANFKPASYLDDKGKTKHYYVHGQKIPQAHAGSNSKIEKYLLKQKVKKL